MRIVLALLIIVGCVSKNITTISYEEEKMINQMLLIGLGDVLEYEKIPLKMKEDIKDVGGVILFRLNAATRRVQNVYSKNQTKKLITNIKENSYITPFIAVDQEGGFVKRLRSDEFFNDVVDLKSNQEMTKLDLKQAYNENIQMAQYLKEIGFTVNFAPAVDLNINTQNPVIGAIERSYSADPKTVFDYANQSVKAHNDAGIISCLKHFPGHGSSQADSHLGFADVSDTWSNLELRPYKDFIKEYSGFSEKNMIMTAHIFNKHLDAKYPATMSEHVNTDILRGEIGFDGILISDDLQMRAIKDHFGLEKIIVEGINSGVDMFIVGNNLNYDPEIKSKFKKIVIKNIKNGKIDKLKILNSYKKIIKIKKLYKILD